MKLHHVGLALVVMGVVFEARAAKPNFIIINVDDLGYADIGPYGSNNHTPNLDRMAKEGRKLTSHYAAPVCSPSRAALMTGCYPKRVLPIAHVLFPAAAVGLNPQEQTIAEVLKDAGYSTACIGKWHLGDQPEFLPTQQGFDEYFGIPYSNDMGPEADGARSNAGVALQSPVDPPVLFASQPRPDEVGILGRPMPPVPLVENERVVGRVRADEQFSITREYTNRAIRFIRAQEGKPFFLYFPHTAVHWPLYPSNGFRGKSPNGLIGDWAEEVDWSVGQILKTLRELKLANNTLVIFTSDNGGVPSYGASNLPLRGSKTQTLEGGIRVCTLAWWPGKIPAGTSTASMTSMADFLPTFAALAGAKLSADRKLDGVNIWPVLAGTVDATPRNEFFYFRGLILEAVRQGPWKLHLRLVDGANGQKQVQPVHLFHLDEDLGEAKNVAETHPDVVKRLQELAQSMANDLGLDGVGPGCRALGRVKNPQPILDYDGTVRAEFVGPAKSFP